MKPGDIVLAALPQADRSLKLRPALVLCSLPPFGDFLLCGVSTQTRHCREGFDEMIDASDGDFGGSGLRRPSVTRLGFLGSVPTSQIAGILGTIESDRLARLRSRLARRLVEGDSF
ncbi:MAG: type II toxin-antitoxin system PemK/MazF family toxin [Akkermansiaceae bacterium]|nr:type II toxin-antitoxin system PemK/MazF family toxin [Akkermansiaceae bacterium]MCP5550028.1 type II toxin-antitoxin system PemK/MazF family toxin [Akkermansiaceae bacterium]